MTTDELWKIKIELVKLLNKGEYESATKYMEEHIDHLDLQMCDMFITGFDITNGNLLSQKLIDKIDSFNKNDFRSSIRWKMLKNLREKIIE